MTDRTGHVLTVAARALRSVVAPAVDAAHPLAEEQIRIVADTLEFLAARAVDERDRTRFTLRAYADLGAVLSIAPSAEVRAARLLLDEPDAAYPALDRARHALTSAIVAALEATTDPAARRRDALAVLRHSRVVIDEERAWFAPFGYDPEPGSVPSLAAALHPSSPPTPSTRK